MTVGFREVHGTTTGKALLAVLLPIVLCCGVIFLAGIAGGMFAAMGAAAAK